MALMLKKKSSFDNWYSKNKEALSKKRKKKYAEDTEYRQRAMESSRRHRRGERTILEAPKGLISFAQAAKSTGKSVSTLHAWKRQKYFPEPKRYGGRLWFTESQVSLLKELKEVFRKYGKQPWKTKEKLLKEVVASIFGSWD